jgi:uncharacterized membrane protein
MEHCASLTGGRPGVLHGNRTYLLQDEDGQILEGHSISAGLDYPGHRAGACVAERYRAGEYVSITDTRRWRRSSSAARPRASSRAGARPRAGPCDQDRADLPQGPPDRDEHVRPRRQGHLMQKEHLIDLLDACVVIRHPGGKVQLKQAVNMTATGASTGLTTGALVGMLAGLMTLNPLAGFAIGGMAGAAMGALAGSLSDYGINDDVIKQIGATLPEGSSALFGLVASATADKVIAEIEPYGPRVLKTSLSNEQEAALKAAIAAAAAKDAGTA